MLLRKGILLCCLGLTLCDQAFALNIEIQAGSIEHPSLPQAIKNAQLSCALKASDAGWACTQGQAGGSYQKLPIDVSFSAQQASSGQVKINGRTGLKALSWSDASGRYASEKLQLSLSFELGQTDHHWRLRIQAKLPAGQVYVEPVFVDFSKTPLQLKAQLDLNTKNQVINVRNIELEQGGVMKARGSLRLEPGSAPDAEFSIHDLMLSEAFQTYVQPYLIGSALEQVKLKGHAKAQIKITAGVPSWLDLDLDPTSIHSSRSDIEIQGLTGTLNWRLAGPAPESRLRWHSARFAKLALEAANMHFSTHDRSLELLSPLRVPVAGGVVHFQEFKVDDVGRPALAAALNARIEPIDLAQLCRVMGWPEFGGKLSGSLPGLTLDKGEIKLDGALTAKAFGGEISVDRLRVLDAFGRVPRISSDIRLRQLDLAALTSAFSFGRIEGRIEGDVQDLRLLKWKPVAFRARISTPANDRSAHRISQRAIDNISSIGGGPSGLLSRSALRFFDDFAYARIGWTCTLSNGICLMGGIEPTDDGGYVLVKGKHLPRIDVVGYSRAVDWSTFVRQLASIQQSGPPSLR